MALLKLLLVFIFLVVTYSAHTTNWWKEKNQEGEIAERVKINHAECEKRIKIAKQKNAQK